MDIWSDEMQIYDVSLTITPDLPVWPGDPSIVLERVGKMEQGGEANVSHISMGVHVGTHVDAPFHFLGGDAVKVDELSLRTLIGPVYLVHLPEVDVITAQVLDEADIPTRTRRVLFKTRNSEYWTQGEKTFQKKFVAISPDGAHYLVKRGVQLVGVDYLSVAPYEDGGPTHRILLNAGVVVVEGLDLSEVSAGRYILYCLPIKLGGADGAPARTILVSE
jgi:arylformamidase